MLNNYNKLLKQGKSYNEAFELSLKNASTSAQNMAINAGGATVKLEKMTVAEKAASVATSLLSKTIKLFTNALIVVAINVFIEWIGKLINSIKEAKQNFAEFSNNFSDNMKSAKDEQNSLDKTISQYIDLTANTKDLTSAKKDLQTIQDSLNEQYGNEAKNIDLVNGKLSEQIQNLVQLKKQKAKEKLSEESNITDPNNKDQKLTNRYAGEYAKNKLKETSSFKTRIKYNNGADLVTGNGIEELYGISGDNATVIDPKGLVDFSEYEVFNILQKYKDNIRLYNSQIYSVGTIEEQLKSLQSFYDELNKLWENKSADSDEKKFLNNLSIEVSNLEKNYNNLNGALTIYNELIKQADESNIKLTDDQQKRYDSFFSDMKNQYLSDRENLNFQAMNDDYQKLSDTKNELVKLFNDNDNKEMAQKVEEFFNSIAIPLNTKTFDISEFSDNIDNLQTKVKSLKETLSKLKDGSITQDELIDFTQEYGLTEYINDIPKLQSELEKLIQTSPDELINKLWELRKSLSDVDKAKVDNLITTLEQLSDIESVSDITNEINTLDDQINGLKDTIDGLDDQIKSIDEQLNNLKDRQSDLQDENSGIQQALEYLIEQNIRVIENQIEPHQKVVDKIEEENDKLEQQNDLYQEQLDLLNEKIGKYETAADVVKDAIQQEIDILNDRKQTVEDEYQTRIDKIQQENDAINEQLELEKKKDAYENAKRRKKLVYTGAAGLQLVTDQTAVDETKKDYNDALASKKISDLEKERDIKINTIEKQIKSWEDYSQRWSDVVDNINKKQDEKTAKEILGSNWRKKINQQDISVLQTFASKYNFYVNVQKVALEKKIQQNEKDIKQNEKIIKSEQKVISEKQKIIEKWNDYKTELSNAISDIEGSNNKYISSLKNLVNGENLTLQNRNKYLSNFKVVYAKNIADINSITNSIKSLENTKTNLENSKTAAQDRKTSLEDKKKELETKANESDTVAKRVKYYIVKNKKGRTIQAFQNKKAAQVFIKDTIKESISDKVSADMAKLPTGLPADIVQNERVQSRKKWEKYYKNYYKVVPKYKTGGVADYTGMAQLDGSKSKSEVIFNSTDAKKLYDLVHNTTNLADMLSKRIVDTMQSGSNLDRNIQTNSSTVTPINIVIEKVVADNPVEFAKQMQAQIEYAFKQMNLDRMIGKIKK